MEREINPSQMAKDALRVLQKTKFNLMDSADLQPIMGLLGGIRTGEFVVIDRKTFVEKVAEQPIEQDTVVPGQNPPPPVETAKSKPEK